MQFDRQQMDKLLSMDDESFCKLARTVAEAAGAGKMKTEALLSNPEILKKRISQLNEQEAQSLIDAAGREKSEEILNLLRKRGVDLG